MNIKDFLIDNYIWIIVIILITIVTIIGFLADKKKENKNKNDANQQPMPVQNNVQGNNVAPMQYPQGQPNQIQQQVNPMPMNNADGQNIQPMQMNPNMVNMNQPVVNQMEQMPVDNTNNNQPMMEVTTQPEQSYQPLSEQKPNIPPQPVHDFSSMNNNPQPISPVDNNYNQNINVQNQISASNLNQPIPVEPMMQNPMNQNVDYNTNMNQPQVDMNNQNNNYNGMVQNNNQMNSTMPMGGPTNMIPIPQPVNPQPIMVNNQPMQAEPMMQNSMNQNIDYNNNFAQQPSMMNSTMPIGVQTPSMNQPMQAEPMMQNSMNQNIDYNNNMVQPQIDMNNQNSNYNGMVQNNNQMNSSPLPVQSPVNFVFGPQNNNPNM